MSTNYAPNPAPLVGRHREGRPIVPVSRKAWDLEARREAVRLDQTAPLWHVIYGIGRRRFYALPVWAAPRGLILEAVTACELQDLMNAASQPVLRGWS